MIALDCTALLIVLIHRNYSLELISSLKSLSVQTLLVDLTWFQTNIKQDQN